MLRMQNNFCAFNLAHLFSVLLPRLPSRLPPPPPPFPSLTLDTHNTTHAQYYLTRCTRSAYVATLRPRVERIDAVLRGALAAAFRTALLATGPGRREQVGVRVRVCPVCVSRVCLCSPVSEPLFSVACGLVVL